MANNEILEAYKAIKSSPISKRGLDIILEHYKTKYLNTLVETKDEQALFQAQGVIKFIKLLEEGLK